MPSISRDYEYAELATRNCSRVGQAGCNINLSLLIRMSSITRHALSLRCHKDSNLHYRPECIDRIALMGLACLCSHLCSCLCSVSEKKAGGAFRIEVYYGANFPLAKAGALLREAESYFNVPTERIEESTHLLLSEAETPTTATFLFVIT